MTFAGRNFAHQFESRINFRNSYIEQFEYSDIRTISGAGATHRVAPSKTGRARRGRPLRPPAQFG
ncbi:hypothetical protein WS86_11120 [Burkholderia savannae]|nr:hypothetical protein WS86_11120 [Burkholderia savannae]